jgi:hypothetical protein
MSMEMKKIITKNIINKMDSRNQISKILKKINTIKIILKKMNKKM